MTEGMNTFGNQNGEAKGDRRMALLFALPGTMESLVSAVAALDAATAQFDAAKRVRAAADTRIAGLQAQLEQLRMRARQSAAQARDARLAALLAGTAGPQQQADDSKITEVEGDIELLREGIPALDRAVDREHLSWSLAYQTLRRAVHDPLAKELQRRAAELSMLAASVMELRGPKYGRGLHELTSTDAAGTAPQQQPNDKVRVSHSSFAGWLTLAMEIAPDECWADSSWLSDMAEFVRGQGQQAVAAE